MLKRSNAWRCYVYCAVLTAGYKDELAGFLKNHRNHDLA
jgi:hypothetical protein